MTTELSLLLPATKTVITRQPHESQCLQKRKELQTDRSKDDASLPYDSDECLADLLGGLSMDGDLVWQEEVEDITSSSTCHKKNQTLNHGRVDLDLLQKQKEEQRKQQHQLDAKHAASFALRLGSSSATNTSLDVRFQNAHGPIQENASWSRPKVAICDMGSIEQHQQQGDDTQKIEDKGKGLVATDFIPKGSVIFTEKAAIATQVPIQQNSSLSLDDAQSVTTPTTMIQACQSCFRSLEPLSKLSPNLPCPDLWPVLPLQWQVPDTTSNTMKKYRSDQFGRIQCLECQALFCCKYCYEKEQHEMNSYCCTFSKLLVFESSKQREEIATTTSTSETDKDDISQDAIRKFGLDQAPVALAAKIFCHATVYHRKSLSLEGHFLWDLCGDANDLNPLEIGIRTTNEEILMEQRRRRRGSFHLSDDENGGRVIHPTTGYTLDPLYQHLKTSLNLTETEQETLSLTFLHMVASKAARNGFGIRTQSPFKPYYSGLLRKFGRDSPAHQSHMKQVAMALSSSTKLERGMDRLVDEQVAPWISGIFRLTAHLNHSCEPNAMVMSQEFVDDHIDLVAKRDILAGEEILISYIQGVDGRQKSSHQRRRELEAKYLFTCRCSKCTYS